MCIVNNIFDLFVCWPFIQVVWGPYRDVLDSLPPYCTAGQHIWRASVLLIYFWIVEDHHPECVFHQFRMKQVPPDIVDTSVDLRRISLQGKLEKDWVQEHVVYIDWWAHREEHLADASALDGDTTYLAAYMESYRRMTRRYITSESAYFEILVRKQFDASVERENSRPITSWHVILPSPQDTANYKAPRIAARFCYNYSEIC